MIGTLVAALLLLPAGSPGQDAALPALRKEGYDRIRELRRRADPAQAAEFSLLALRLAEAEISEGSLESAFRFLAEGIYLESRVLGGSPGGDLEPSRCNLAALYETWGVALTHLGEFELAIAAFDIAGEELGRIAGAAALFPPGAPVRRARQQESFVLFRKASALRTAGDAAEGLSLLDSFQDSKLLTLLDPTAKAFFHSQRGNCLEDLGRLEEALEAYERARSWWEVLGERRQEALERKTIGDTLRKLGRPSASLEQYRTAEGLLKGERSTPLVLHEVWADMALPLLDLGRKKEALSLLEDSLGALEQWRRKLSGTRFGMARALSFATVSRALGAWVRAKLETEGEEAARETFDRVDRFRALGLLEQAAYRKGRLRPEERTLERERSRLRREIELQQGDLPSQESNRRSLSQVEIRLMAMQLQDRLAGSREAQAPLELRLPPDTSLLGYLAAPEDLFVWVASRSGWHLVSLARGREAAELGRMVEGAVRRISSAPDPDASDGASAVGELARLLLPPAVSSKAGPASRFWIVPDGPAHQAPFAALFAELRGGIPEIVVLPSARFGAGLAAGPKNPAGGGIAILAAPADAPPGFDPLVFSEQEGREIASILAGPTTLLLTGKEASESRFKRDAGREVSMIHLSAHGVFSPALSGGSAVLLASDEREDGWLWASEIAALPLGAGLVTLSSCHAASGEWIAGEGVSGLSRAFLAAGARAVVGSLWAVDQRSTGVFMKEFYRGLGRGEPVAAALAKAQEALRSEAPYSHPYYWAGFRVEGDGAWRSPVAGPSPEAPPSFPWSIFLGGAALTLALAFSWGVRRRRTLSRRP